MRIILKNVLYFLVFLLAFPGFTAHLAALDPDKSINHYLLDEWGLDKGFPAGTVYSIAQTPDGYLWLGTSVGLVRYDGVRFETMVIDNSLKPLERWVGSLLVDKQGDMWMAGERGLIRYKSGMFTIFTTENGLSGNVIMDIAEDSYGNLWVGTYERFLNRFKDGEFTVFDTAGGIESRGVNAIHEDSKGVLWIAGNTGLFYRQGDIFKKYISSEIYGNCTINVIYEDRENVLWVGTDKGLVGIENALTRNERVSVFTTKNGLVHNHVWIIREDGSGNLWIGTRGALHRLKRETGGQVSIDTCLDDISIVTLFEDREGSLWIGTFHYGLKRLRDAAIKTYFKEEGLPPYKLTLYKGQTGDIWVGTTSGGLFRFSKSNGKFYKFVHTGNNVTRPVTAIAEDREGDIWFGTDRGGLFQVNIKKGSFVRKYTAGKDGPGHKINAIARDGRNNLMIGTDGGGMLRYDGDVFTSYSTAEGLIDDHVTNVYEDSKNNIWIGTRKGLLLLLNGQWDEKNMKTYLPGLNIQGIYEESRGILWIGTSRSGLIRLKDEKIFSYTVSNGLASNSIYQIVEDSRENFWLSSFDGIIKVGKKALTDLSDGRTDRIGCTIFGLSDGMLDSQCVMSPLNSVIKTGDEFWFATQKGISILKPGKIRINKSPPQVVIDKILLNGDPIPRGKKDPVFRGVKNIRFHFTAPTFISAEKVKVFFKLEGYRQEWQTVDAFQERTAYYKNLPAGDYRFLVTAANADGIRNPTGVSFDFTLKLYIHQALWFKILSVLLAVSAVLAGFFRFKRYLYIRRLKNKYKNSTLDPEKAEMALKKLRYLLEVKKVFKDENLSRETLAAKLAIPPRFLSQIMSEQLEKNFWEVVNGFRVEEAKKMLANTVGKDYSILEIAFEVGFSSKEAFNRAFKKFTGKTPSQFKKGPALS